MEHNEDWKPEIEHIKGSDLLKKKKKKVDLPPHLRLSAMKKAFAHTNEAASYKDFMKDKEKTQERLAKKISDRKEKDKLYVDIKKKGIKFYDKKGSGRVVKGRKVYD